MGIDASPLVPTPWDYVMWFLVVSDILLVFIALVSFVVVLCVPFIGPILYLWYR